MIKRDYLEIMASALTDKTGVRIMAGDTWRADIRQRTLEYDREDLTRLDFDLSKGLLLHELGHIKYTQNPGDTPTSKKYPATTHDIINAFEDIRIEKRLTDELGYFASAPLTNLSGASIADNIAKSSGDFRKLPKLHQFLHTALMAKETERNDFISRKIGYHAYNAIRPNGYSTPPVQLSPEVLKIYAEHSEEIFRATTHAEYADSTQEVADIIEGEIIPLIPEDFFKEAEKYPPMQAQPKAKNGKQKQQTTAGQKAKQAGQYANPKGTLRKLEKRPEFARTMCEYGAQARTLGQRLADILEERRATKYTGAHPSGRLQSKNAFKILNGETRIFSRKQNNKPDKYRFIFCLDSSGSMDRNSAGYHAVQACQIMQIALDGFRLPMSFYRYDETASKLRSLDEYDAIGGGTDDTEMLKLVLEEAKSYPSDEKIVFMLTDGYTLDNNERRELMKQIEANSGSIFAIGIGIFPGQGLTENYDNTVKVETPAELPSELLRLMRGIIAR